MALYILKANGEIETREFKLARPASRGLGRITVKLACHGLCWTTPGWREGSVPSVSISGSPSPERMGPPSSSLPLLTCSLGLQEEGVAVVPKEEVLLGQPVDGGDLPPQAATGHQSAVSSVHS